MTLRAAVLFAIGFCTSGLASADAAFEIRPISHASAVLEWDGRVIYVDPVGGAEPYAGQPAPDWVLVTDIHGDHYNAETLAAVLGEDSVLIAPKAVIEQMPASLAKRAQALANGESTQQDGFEIEAIPMYNLPPSEQAFHPKGRGNGYVIAHGGRRVYFAGDTQAVPEMRALKDIDDAFVPMNLPYTMTVDEAADGVLEFAPKRVYPYHYRGKEGYSDVERFTALVKEGNSGIEVRMLEWYP